MTSMKRAPSHPTAIAQLQSESLTSLAQQEIERMILSGELTPGGRIGEAELAARLGVSRGPVREAFRALEEGGLLRVEKHRGVFVRTVTIEEAEECYTVRAALEASVARILAERITEDELDELRTLLGRMDKAAAQKQASRYATFNFEIHDRFVALTGNAKLTSIYRRLVKELILFRYQTLVRSDVLEASLAEHRAIVEAIASRDPKAAEQAMLAHIAASLARTRAAHAASEPLPPNAPETGKGGAPDPNPSKRRK